MHCDNKSAVSLAVEGASWRSRHFLIRASALRETIKKGFLRVKWLAGKNMLADALTKHVGKQLLSQHKIGWNLFPLKEFL